MTHLQAHHELNLITRLLNPQQNKIYSLAYIDNIIHEQIDISVKMLLIERYFEQNNLLSKINYKLIYHVYKRQTALEQQIDATSDWNTS